MGTRQAPTSPQSQHPPDCCAIKNETLWSVWSVAWKQREQRTQLSSRAQSLGHHYQSDLDQRTDRYARTYLQRKQLSPFLKIYPQGLPGTGGSLRAAPAKLRRAWTSARVA